MPRRNLGSFPPFSYRSDPTVPSFPDDRPLIVFDGVCVLCSGFARFVVRRDPQARFRLTTAQSPLGQALYLHYGLETEDYETNLVIAGGRAFSELGSVAEVGRRLGGIWRMLAVLDLIPQPISGWLYDRIARNRYRLFGRTDACMVPPADWRDRMIK